MNPIDGLRTWWQTKTGEEETPFDGDGPVWVISMLFHLGLMFMLAFVVVDFTRPTETVSLAAPLEEEPEELELQDDFEFDDQISDEIGARSVDGTQVALALAPEISDVPEVFTPTELTPTEVGDIEINEAFEVARGLQFAKLPVKGHAGVGATGAPGAIDRITKEILLSLEERKTLVVWLFDQSASLIRQRQDIHDRFERIYEELGVIEAAGNPAFKLHKDKPLLTSIIGFGNDVVLLTPKPIDNLAEMQEKITQLKRDDTGQEKVFSAVYMAAEKFKSYREIDRETREPKRNVLMIVVSDEAGDDQEGLDQTVRVCRRYEMPVYVIGVPAPFGRVQTMVKWVDPDPEYDQRPSFAPVKQGPESFMPERVKLSFEKVDDQREEMIDSGFGPFSLTRLAYETGGIYFAVHPNRTVKKEVSRRDTQAFSAHISHFFDSEVMRRYRPDYVSRSEYMKRVAKNKARSALIQAAKMSWLTPMESPATRFPKRDEATFVNSLTEAQKAAAKLAPKINFLYETLKLGESDRAKESSLRWQAGFDLAMGRVMANKVRTEAYNAMLAKAKRGMKFKDGKSNVWNLEPADEISTGSAMAKTAKKAKEFLQRVVDDHPSTPWALLAEKELDNPVGWKWTEEYDAPPAPRPRNTAAGNNNVPAPAKNDAKKMINKGKPKRAVPKL